MGYLGSALTTEESNLFIAKYNKKDKRSCAEEIFIKDRRSVPQEW